MKLFSFSISTLLLVVIASSLASCSSPLGQQYAQLPAEAQLHKNSDSDPPLITVHGSVGLKYTYTTTKVHKPK